MHREMPAALTRLLSEAELAPVRPVGPEDLWRRGRRRRHTKAGTAGAVLIAASLIVVAVANQPNGAKPSASSTTQAPPTAAARVLETPDPSLCTAAAAQARLKTFVAEFNSGDPNIVDDSVATESRLVFVQAPGFVFPTPPSTVRQALTPYFHQLYARGDRLKFVSLTPGPIDSSGDRDFGYQLLHSTAAGQQQAAGGTGSVDCYAGKISALYLSW